MVLSSISGNPDCDAITGLHRASFEDNGKDPFPRHDTIPGLMIDRTAVVALLADLGHFQHSTRTNLQLRSQG
jgi:hypothetical protein